MSGYQASKCIGKYPIDFAKKNGKTFSSVQESNGISEWIRQLKLQLWKLALNLTEKGW